MPDSTVEKPFHPNKLIWYFLACWTVLNIIQASSLELQADEAYYWMYSRFFDWGYFDHPPMVALFIWLGDHVMHNELGLRLLTVLASSGSVYVLWLILKKYTTDAVSFILLVPGIFILHMYGFTTTPDAPLFFFTVLFYFFYRRYIDEDTWGLAIILGIIVACLLYSKYNGVLLVGFTLISNWKLLKRWSFWLIVGLSVALYLPHILWQINHGYPSINYHLFERSADTYSFTNTIAYIPAQLIMAGPLIGWFLFYKAFTTRIKDAFIRCLMVNCVGTLIFFWISSLKGEVQPQWTFILYAPLIMLVMIKLQQAGSKPKWLMPLAVVNIVIILIVRVSIIIGFDLVKENGHLKSYYGFRDWVAAVKRHAGDNYVVMSEGFQNPSKYNYYTNSLKAFAYDDRYYRRTQYDIWPIEDSLQHKKVYYLINILEKGLATDSIKLPVGTWYGSWVDDVRTYQKILVGTNSYKINAHPGQKTVFDLTVTNPYDHTVNFSNINTLHPVFMEACLFDGNNMLEAQKADSLFNSIQLKPGASARYTFTLTAPLKKGKYDLLFSIRTEPFRGGKNSRIITYTVE